MKNLSLEIEKGEKIAVIGKIGSGKSTLLSCILGAVPSHLGGILVK